MMRKRKMRVVNLLLALLNSSLQEDQRHLYDATHANLPCSSGRRDLLVASGAADAAAEEEVEEEDEGNAASVNHRAFHTFY